MNERPEDDAMFGDRSDLAWIERLLDGADGVDRDECPAECAGLADVLLAARAPASPAEFAGEAAVMAMFRSTVAGAAAGRSPFARRAKAIAVAASLGATAMTGAAAAAGRLPPDIQDMASELLDRVGIRVPTANRTDGPIEVPTELPIEGPAGASGRAAAGSAADAPTAGPSGPPPLTRIVVSDTSVDVADTLAAPGIADATTDPSTPPTDASVPPLDGTIPVTAQDAAAAPSTAVQAAQATAATSPGGRSDVPTAAHLTGATRRGAGAGGRPRAAGAAERDTGWTPGDGSRARARRSAGRPARRCPGQLAARRGRPARPPMPRATRMASRPAGPPADVPANSHASPPAGPPADVPANSHASRPAGPPADVPANSHASPPAGRATIGVSEVGKSGPRHSDDLQHSDGLDVSGE